MSDKTSDSIKRPVVVGSAPDATKAASTPRVSWRVVLVVALAMVGLSLVGFALTNYAPDNASWFWVLVLPGFAAIAIWHTWKSVRADGKTNWPVLRKQIYHWIAFFIAIKIMFVLIYTGNISGRGGGLVALLLMALTCTLVGVSFDWLFIFVGALLGIAVLVAAWFQEYVWLVLLALGLAFAVLVLVQYYARRQGAD
ncbi:MAG: hypothetical protein ABSG53_26885 [Thermoguttaceae bacterium]|jgi:magnesium-transporting ATPase (P-type)